MSAAREASCLTKGSCLAAQSVRGAQEFQNGRSPRDLRDHVGTSNDSRFLFTGDCPGTF